MNEEGLGRLIEVLRSTEDTASPETRALEKQIAQGYYDTVSLETKHVEAGYDPEDETAVEDFLQVQELLTVVLRLLTNEEFDDVRDDVGNKLGAAEARRQRLARLTPEDLDILIKALEENFNAVIRGFDPKKVRAVLTTARVLRNLHNLTSNGHEYLRVLRLRARARQERQPISRRSIARTLDISEAKLRRWDERAEKLGVTLEDWDWERLRQIVYPARPPPQK